MRDLVHVFSAVAGAALLAACTSVDAVPVTAKSGAVNTGFRIPAVKPLLVVGSQVGIILVPNPNRGTAIRFSTFLAKNDLTLDFSQGMLQSVSSSQDSTPVPDAFFAALGQAAAAGHSLLGSAFAGQLPSTPTAGKFQIYDIQFDEDGNLTGLKPLINDSDLRDFGTFSILSPGGTGTTPPPAVSPPAADVTPLPGTQNQKNNQGANQGAVQQGAKKPAKPPKQ